jgi:hypothetical protein
MTFSDGRPAEGQNLPLDWWNGKIVIDAKAVLRLKNLVDLCLADLDDPRDSSIVLTCLDTHLTESTLPEPARSSQALLLLKLYRNSVPPALELANQRLQDISTALLTIVRTAERAEGGSND